MRKGLEWGLRETMSQYVALLRGINVGGNNLIKMTELKTCFEKERFRHVTTYIQSGNVIFEAPASTTRHDRAQTRSGNCSDTSPVGPLLDCTFVVD